MGALSYTAALDPLLFGGFAAIESTIAFDRVALTFNASPNPIESFAVDNAAFIITSSVPEPSTLLLALAGLVLVFLQRTSTGQPQ